MFKFCEEGIDVCDVCFDYYICKYFIMFFCIFISIFDLVVYGDIYVVFICYRDGISLIE